MEKVKEIKEKKKLYYQVKFIIIGNPNVGKTNIYYKFVNGEFSNKYQPTIVLDFQYQTIKINEKFFTLQLWDTAGSEDYKSITKGYYSNSTCCILVYDLTEEDSFNSIIDWVEDVKNYTSPKTILILVGNKYDLSEERKISKEQGEALASQYGMTYIEASAKTGYNIDEIFNIACQKIYENIDKKIYNFNNYDEPCGVKKCYANDDLSSQKTFTLKKKNNNIHIHKKKKIC